MSYSPTNWTDGTTPVDASNLNKIEDALVDQDSRIDANTDLIGNFSQTNISSLDDMTSYFDSIERSQCKLFSTAASAVLSFLTKEDASGNRFCAGIAGRTNADYITYFMQYGNNGTIYSGRITSSGDIEYLVKISGTSL